jgi:hypothetical protein
MRPSNKSRSRNKSGNNQQRRGNIGNIVNRVFESAGPDGKVRGTPQQIIDKYQVLARDAQVSGDRVAAENYLQHAEHYARLLGEAQRQSQEMRQQEREEREERGEEAGRPEAQREQVQREGEAAEGERHDARRNGRDGEHRRRERASEPAGLTVIGEDERESGPVETPENAGWVRTASDGDADAATTPSAEAAGTAEPAAGEAPAAAGGEAPAPKRPRARRKTKPASEVIEASAE